MTESINRDLQRKVARAELSRRAFWMAVALLLVGYFGVMGWTVYEVRQTQTEGTPQGRRIVQLQETISDCVNPQGDCYKRGQKRTGDAIATLNLATLYAVYCVDRNPRADVPAIQACVRDLYADGE